MSCAVKHRKSHLNEIPIDHLIHFWKFTNHILMKITSNILCRTPCCKTHSNSGGHIVLLGFGFSLTCSSEFETKKESFCYIFNGHQKLVLFIWNHARIARQQSWRHSRGEENKSSIDVCWLLLLVAFFCRFVCNGNCIHSHLTTKYKTEDIHNCYYERKFSYVL